MTLADAIAFAALCHEGQTRKGTDIPYIVHPMEACAIAATLTSNPQVLAAAVLHDVVEDCGVPVRELEDRFGKRVAELVAAQSEQKEEDEQGSWTRRKQHTIDRLKCASTDELILTLSDKLSNLRAILRDYEKLGDGLWERFNQKDKVAHGWYYLSIQDALRPLTGSPAYKEYAALADRVFGCTEAE